MRYNYCDNGNNNNNNKVYTSLSERCSQSRVFRVFKSDTLMISPFSSQLHAVVPCCVYMQPLWSINALLLQVMPNTYPLTHGHSRYIHAMLYG